MADNDDIKVEYTVKELLARIEEKQTAGFANLDGKLASKADKADLVVLRTDVDLLLKWKSDKEAAADAHAKRDQQQERRKNWRLAIAGLAGTGAVALATVLPQVLH